MAQRTATVSVYDTSGTGSPLGVGGNISFPEKPGLENRLSFYMGWTMVIHTFRLPFSAEVYGVRVSMGVVNGPVRTGGMRFDRIEITLDSGTPSIQTDASNPYIYASDDTIVIGGNNGGGSVRHQLGPRNATRVRFAVDDNMDAIIAAAAPARRGFTLSPGFPEVPFPTSMKITGGGGLTQALARGFFPNTSGTANLGRRGLVYPFQYLEHGEVVGQGGAGDYFPGHQLNYVVALKRANGAADRETVDCLDFGTGDPAGPSLVTHSLHGSDRRNGYCSNVQSVQPQWRFGVGSSTSPTTIGGQLPEFWNGNPHATTGDSTAGTLHEMDPFWHNSTAGTYEDYMVFACKPSSLTHKGVVVCELQALAEVWNDPIAQFDLWMLAQDVEYQILRYLTPMEATYGASSGSDAGGGTSSTYGGRFLAWTQYCLWISPAQRHKELARKIGGIKARQQMSNGFCDHHSYDPNTSPNPWLVGNPFPTDWDVHQVMEMTIQAWVWAQMGFHAEATKFVDALYVGGAGSGGDFGDLSVISRNGGGSLPKYVATRKTGVVEHRISSINHISADFWQWVSVAMGIWLSAYTDQYPARANALSLPNGGTGGSTAATIAALLSTVHSGTNFANLEQTGLAVAALTYLVP